MYIKQWVEVAGVPCPEYGWEPEYAEDIEQETAYPTDESEEL